MGARRIGGSWYVDFRFENQRYRRRSPVQTKLGALRWETELRERLVDSGSIASTDVAQAQSMDLSGFFPGWFETYVATNNKASEQKTKARTFRAHLLPFFGDMPLDRIDPKSIEHYKAEKLAQGLKAKTINNHLTMLRKSLDCAVEWGYLDALPRVRRLRVEPVAMDALSGGEVDKLERAAGEPVWHAAAVLALNTGLRRGELFALDWQQVDLERAQITVLRSTSDGVTSSTKSHRIRYVPMNRGTQQLLLPLRRSRGLVFHKENGDAFADSVTQRGLRRLCRAAGIRQIGWHKLRHTFATRLALQGTPIHVVKDLLGHADISTTMRYAHVQPSSLDQAVALLDRPVGAKKAGTMWAPGAVANQKSP